MALSWNEIKKRAMEFSKEYANATRENAETHSFYNDFFHVFGISRRRVASFEEPVKKLGNKKGRIDLFWKGKLLVEQKSGGKALAQAKQQALDYFPNLKEYELPKYIMVSDFQNFELYDLEENTEHQFKLADLHQNVNLFGFIAGYTKRKFADQEHVNIQAGELIGELHDRLVDNGYTGHELEQFLIRLLFCLFADDTGIFEKDIFKFFVEERTSEDGSDLGGHLSHIFQILDTAADKRQKNLDEHLTAFPYVNGKLFEGILKITSFDSAMRAQLIKCCNFNWGQISPAIFGAMFQSATDQKKRRNLGAHYTSEQNIMKIIQPLFLDDLHRRFEKIKHHKKSLVEFHKELAGLRFLDPACGCGNFLIVAYRELRSLEINILKILHNDNQDVLDVKNLSQIDVDQFYGIEIEELPAKIAEVAMWLVDHQMNIKLGEALGKYYVRIPLRKSANILHANALRVDWKDLVTKDKLSYILGNPPFIGSRMMTNFQKNEAREIFSGIKGAGLMDFVTCWYIKAAQYIQGTNIKVAFVSTNSISQGEQVGILWNELFSKYYIKIHFAHRTFAWNNEARGKANVFVVIIGFAAFNIDYKYIYEYETPTALEPHEINVTNINPYLTAGSDLTICSRQKTLSNVPEMVFGNMPRDGGNLILSEEEKFELIKHEPHSTQYIRPYTGAFEFLNNKKRYCLWLLDCPPTVLRNMPKVLELVENTKKFRLSSKAESTRKFARTPTIFCQITQPKSDYLLIPRVSSERRKYIPMGFLAKDVIANDQVLTIQNANLYFFGVLTSLMHNDWMRYVAGRLKSDYRYSKDIVYNNFPWPKNSSAKQTRDIEEKAQAVLDVRKEFPGASLADLYHPLTMPAALQKAHNQLDKAVDTAYGKSNFNNERERIEFLFKLYQEYTAPLINQKKNKR